MNDETILKQNRKLKKAGFRLFLLGIIIFFIFISSGLQLNGLALRASTQVARWALVAVLGFVFAGLLIYICTLLYSTPHKSRGARMIQKTFMVLMMILILVATVLIFLYNFIFLIFTVKKESTIVVDGTTYIKREVSAAEDPSRIQYHEVVTPFFYKEGPTDSIINQEKHTGIILSAHRRGGDSGSVYILEVDIGSDNPLEFTMPDNPTFPLTEPVPTGITVQIECDLHPKSDYHIIRKMTPIRL